MSSTVDRASSARVVRELVALREAALERARGMTGVMGDCSRARALLHDAASQSGRGTGESASQTERGWFVDASTTCGDESFGREDAVEDDAEGFERRLARALRACEDALALANASDVVDPFGMLARGARGRME